MDFATKNKDQCKSIVNLAIITIFHIIIYLVIFFGLYNKVHGRIYIVIILMFFWSTPIIFILWTLFFKDIEKYKVNIIIFLIVLSISFFCISVISFLENQLGSFVFFDSHNVPEMLTPIDFSSLGLWALFILAIMCSLLSVHTSISLIKNDTQTPLD